MAQAVLRRTLAVGTLDKSVISGVTLDSQTAVTLGSSTASLKAGGFMKTANVFLKILLTAKGSNLIVPNEGTDFSSIVEGNVSEESVVFAFVTQCVKDASEQTISYQQNAAAPQNERLSSAAISAFTFNAQGPGLDFSVDLFNALGEKFTLSVPSTVFA